MRETTNNILNDLTTNIVELEWTQGNLSTYGKGSSRWSLEGTQYIPIVGTSKDKVIFSIHIVDLLDMKGHVRQVTGLHLQYSKETIDSFYNNIASVLTKNNLQFVIMGILKRMER